MMIIHFFLLIKNHVEQIVVQEDIFIQLEQGCMMVCVKNVKLVAKAAETENGTAAQQFSQAALNAAHALQVLGQIERSEKATD